MDLALKDNVALIAGSSRGIGKAIARSFLQEGARVVISGRDQDSLERTAREFRDVFGTASILHHVGDMTDPLVIRKAVQEVRDHWGKIDSVVANIGNGKATTGWHLDPGECSSVFNTNCFGAIFLIDEVMPHLIESGHGSVVIVSSIAGVEASSAPLAYSSAKAALLNYGKNLARLVARRGVRVNIVAPGNILFAGGSWDERRKNSPREVQHHLEAEVPMARFGRPEEIADFVVFLCSARASFAAGMCAVLDGGQTRTT